MNRLRVAILIFVSFFWVAIGQAASGGAPADQQQVVEGGATGTQTPITPQAALTWQAQEQARFENQRRAAEMRQMEMNRANANQEQQQTGK